MKRFIILALTIFVLSALMAGFVWAGIQIGFEASLIWSGLAGLVAWAIKSNYDRKREHARLLAADKREQYRQFNEFVTTAFGQHRNNPGAEIKLDIEGFQRWSLQLALIGSDEVVRAWNEFRLGIAGEADSRASEDPLPILRQWGRLLMAMRRDTGHFDTRLTEFDILSIIVTDLDKYPALNDVNNHDS